MTDKLIILTHELIEAGSFGGPSGWNRKQLEILGVSWPPEKGWKSNLAGTRITTEKYEEFMSLRGMNKRARRLAGHGDPTLFRL